jgi:hypothetical protein
LGVNEEVQRIFWSTCEDNDFHDHHHTVAQQILEARYDFHKDDAQSDVEHLKLAGFEPSSPIFEFVSVEADSHVTLFNKLQKFFFLFFSSDVPVSQSVFPYRDSFRNQPYMVGNITSEEAANYREGIFYVN